MSKIAVLLATYNGEKYLNEQVESILSQSLEEFTLYISDDSSNDNTRKIIEGFVLQDKRVVLLDSQKKGGAKENFDFLMRNIDADYYFFADQDDIWHKDKMEILYRYMRFYEDVFGSHLPLLVHGDLKIIDSAGEIISNSMWDYQNLDPKWGERFNLILTQNIVTGCNMIINRALLDIALPTPKEAIMHDWWLALVACAFGRVCYISEPGVLYRQHGKNEVGAKAFNISYIISKLLNEREDIKRSKTLTYMQAGAFADKYQSAEKSSMAEEFHRLQDHNKIRRLTRIYLNRFYKIGLLRNIGWAII